MSDLLYVHIDGKIHSYWTSVVVARSIERGAHSFELTLTDSFESSASSSKQTSPRVIKRGQGVEIFINNELVMSGYIDDVNPSYNATTHTLQITGRSKIGDLIDCSTVGQQFKKGVTLRQIAENLCTDFGIDVTVDNTAKAAANEKFTADYMLDIGQSIWEFLEDLARIKAVLLVSDRTGNLIITRAGSKKAAVALELGKNIKSASGTFSNRGVFSLYTVCAQQSSAPQLLIDAPTKTQPKATTASKGRYRPNVVCSDSPTDAYHCRVRAEWNQVVSEGRAESVVYTVQGWRQKEGGALWEPNSLVSVKDAWMGWNAEFLIVETRVLLDEKGSSTEIMVMPQGAFALVPEQEAAEKQRGWL